MESTTVSVIVKYSIPVFIIYFPSFLGILELKYGVRVERKSDYMSNYGASSLHFVNSVRFI
jgi:hypothetical protein